jgi:glutamine amidotransferase
MTSPNDRSSRGPRRAVIVNAGVGNLGNLARALAHLGARPEITDDPDTVADARCVLLPGVGAFAPPRERLRGSLEEALHRTLERGGWLLGICVGFQLLFDAGEEFGETDGLRLLRGRVTRLPEGVPLPHIGWNRLHGLHGPVGEVTALLAGIGEGSYVYFVHSFAPEGVPREQVLATATHGRSFPAVVGAGRVLGTQFHPEKSGETGLRILANFLGLAYREDP